jgi:hypothetical protein
MTRQVPMLAHVDKLEPSTDCIECGYSVRSAPTPARLGGSLVFQDWEIWQGYDPRPSEAPVDGLRSTPPSLLRLFLWHGLGSDGCDSLSHTIDTSLANGTRKSVAGFCTSHRTLMSPWSDRTQRIQSVSDRSLLQKSVSVSLWGPYSFESFQVRGNTSGSLYRNPTTNKGRIASPAKEPSYVKLSLLGRQLLPPPDVEVVDTKPTGLGQLFADGTGGTLSVCHRLPVRDGQTVLLEGCGGWDL